MLRNMVGQGWIPSAAGGGQATNRSYLTSWLLIKDRLGCSGSGDPSAWRRGVWVESGGVAETWRDGSGAYRLCPWEDREPPPCRKSEWRGQRHRLAPDALTATQFLCVGEEGDHGLRRRRRPGGDGGTDGRGEGAAAFGAGWI